MAAASQPSRGRRRRRESVAAEDPARALGKAPVHIFLRRRRRCCGSSRRSACSSRRSCRAEPLQQQRLVEGLLEAEPGDLVRTTARSSTTPTITHSLLTTLEIAIGGTVAADHRRRARRLRVRLARLPGPRLALHRRDRAARRAAADGADPDLLALQHARHLRHVFGLILFHTAFGAAVRDLPAAQLLHRDTEGHPRVGAHRRRVGDPHLRAADPAARPAGDRVARDLPVPLDVERPARRARRSAATRSRSRSRSSRSCGSSARTSR